MFTKTIPQRPTSTNDEFNLMNSSKPVGGDARFRRGAWIGGIVAVIVVVVGGLWLARKPIAESVGRSYCSGEGLDCELHFARLDFGGVVGGPPSFVGDLGNSSWNILSISCIRTSKYS